MKNKLEDPAVDTDSTSYENKWLAYLAVAGLWFVLDIALQAAVRFDGRPPLSFWSACVSAVIFCCVVSGVSDLWRRFVRRDLIGLAIISLLLFALQIWAHLTYLG